MRVWVVRAVLVGFVACGGKTASDELDGGGADSSTTSPADGGFADVRTHPNPNDASATVDTGPSPPHCSGNGGGGGSSGPGTCEVFASEDCDGVHYEVTCSCPEATCQCTGSTGGLAKFNGCPACPTMATALAACGFPH